jgi:Uri superfamily endonuclease
LIIFVNGPTHTKAAKHNWLFQKGYYAYIGSAVGHNGTNLRQRVARHLRKRKKQHWHIDYFLAGREARVMAIVAAGSDVNKECEITRGIQNIEGATIPVVGFGASDCRRNCKSHLVYFGSNVRLESIVEVYRRVSGSAQLLRTNHFHPESE